MRKSEETRFQELKRYVRLGPEDQARLAAFRPIARPHFERIADAFYERIREHEGAHAVLRDEEQIARLRASLVRWLERLLSGTYDEAYFEETSLIGRVHVRVGLPQRYMLVAMALIRVELFRVAPEGPEGAALRESISRLLDVELAIMLESYREDHVRLLERRAERGALERDALYVERALELVGAMIVGVDQEGNIQLFNREAERVTGHSRDEVLGTSFFVQLLGDDSVGHDAAAEVLSGAAELARVEAPLVTRAGRVRKVRWHLTHTRAAKGELVPLEMVAAGIDITEEHQAREKARASEKLASLGMLAAGLAHEIRNPLNGAQLHLALIQRELKKTGASADLQEATGVVEQELKRLARLVSEFLEFARPRPLERRPARVAALCERVIAKLQSSADAAGVLLVPDMPTGDLVVAVDGAKVEEALAEVVENAIDALRPRGRGRVVVRARRQPRAVVIDVEDDGPGVPAGVPVFDAFYSTKAQGTGLGLAVAMRAISDHGGTIQLESEPGRTRFSVVLPWEPVDEASEEGA